jgi:hypothetical protein
MDNSSQGNAQSLSQKNRQRGSVALVLRSFYTFFNNFNFFFGQVVKLVNQLVYLVFKVGSANGGALFFDG